MVPTLRRLVVCSVLLLATAARAAPNDLDPAFGAGGLVHVLAGTDARARAAVLQPDGRIVIAGDWNGKFLLQRFEANGALDAGFGVGGTVTTAIGDSAGANALALQTDGKLVAAGSSSVGGISTLTLARYANDGALDASFGTAGILTTAFQGVANAVVLQTDGKLLAGGAVGGGAALVRFGSDGAIDTTFGAMGVAVANGIASVHGLVLQPDQRIVACMEAGGTFIVGRYDVAGVLDPTFSDDGIANPYTISTYCRAVTLQPDGKIVAVGEAPFGQWHFLGSVVRLLPDGSLDPSFPSNQPPYVPDGVRLWSSSLSTFFHPHAVVVDGSARILAAGQYRTLDYVTAGIPHTSDHLRVDRLIADGTGDPSFPSAVSFNGPFGGGVVHSAEAVLLQPDLKIVIAGWADGVALARYLGTNCGDGNAEGGEPCDDGNVIDGDGCDTNCTLTSCGNGIVTAGEECDGGPAADDCCSAACTFETNGTTCHGDGNVCTDDVCNGTGTCGHVANAAPCDDGFACTTGDICTGGSCQGGAPTISCPPCEACDEATVTCRAVPRPSCTTTSPRAARFTLKDAALNAKDQLRWQWTKGTVALAAFGDPTTTDDYTLCVYDDSPTPTVRFSAWIPAGGMCGNQSCWRGNSKGFRYKRNDRAPEGVQTLTLGSGIGKAKLTLKGGRELLSGRPGGLPALPFPIPLRVQLQGAAGACWEATFSVPDVNVATEFDARSN